MPEIDITYSREVDRYAVGSIEVDASADIDVAVGFIPKAIRLVCDDASGDDWVLEWHEGFGSGKYFMIAPATGVVTETLAATGGPVALTGEDGRRGFTIPAALVAASDVIYFHAYR